ncbi:hypothetical protein GALMADRAFT_156362 [Galerina marginata CBS 339.88]|uniref:NAD(P)-binding domain-containing protein n=1 Tax=Galerina marginata (strain CBS 339.88) TaxID=685588 RepID=A0A067T8L9_GALM3|nr:hypothetical protein GALMADRAFT_156362 [Galerina marginata CBS 339.88]
MFHYPLSASNPLGNISSMSTQTKIFITGATGFIGGSILQRLLDHPDAAKFNFTALVRSKEKADKFNAIGVKGVTGTLQDLPLLENLSADADIVLSNADNDDLDMAQAILRGMKRHRDATGVIPTLIHTSGTGCLADDATGDRVGEVIYDDLNPDQIETLADTQQHRNVDLELVKADKEGYVKTYIVLPSHIYGLATGKLVNLGIQNPQSILIPLLTRAALSRGRGGMVGAGRNVWPNVHIDDVADLYIILLDLIRSNPASVGHGREGFYFGENGENTFYDMTKAIAEGLVTLGKATNPGPSTFTDEEIKLYFQGSTFWGSNSRCHANRSRAIGWKPVKTTQDLLASILPEIEVILKNDAAT